MKPSTILAIVMALIFSLASVTAGASLAMLWAMSKAHAHSWYDNACCSEEDCHRIEPSELSFNSDKWIWTSAKTGAVHVIHTGSRSPVDGQFRIRNSKDGQYHGCERNLADKPGDAPRWFAYCLYFPELY